MVANGEVRIGPIVYSVDVATGLAMGVTVLADERSVVTTDLDIRIVTPVTTGPVRVDAEVLRAGATTAVSAFTLTDESTGRIVGGGTCTGRPFPLEFDRALLDVPIGVRRQHAPTEPVAAESPATYLGFRIAEGGAVEVDIAGWLRNPLGHPAWRRDGVPHRCVGRSSRGRRTRTIGARGGYDRPLPRAGSRGAGAGSSPVALDGRRRGAGRGQGDRRGSRRSTARGGLCRCQ